MTSQEFHESLQTGLTIDCQLPFTVPTKAMDLIIKNTYEWFVRNWEDCLESVYISIPFSLLSNDINFKMSRKIKLPDCVYSVNAVAKDRRSKQNITGFTDITFSNYLYSNWGVNGGFSGIENTTQSDAIMGFVIASSWGDLSYHMTNYPISYDYNRLTKKLFFKGSLEGNPDFVLDCDIKVPVESLYELDLFYKYCLGMIKKSLSNIIGTFNMTLPGGASIDFDRYQSQGSEEIQEVVDEIKGMSSNSSFFLHTGSL